MTVIRRLGEKIRRLRDRSGLNQTELAQRLGLSEKSKGYVSEIESGKKIPPAEKLITLADIFQVSLDVLLRDELDIE